MFALAYFLAPILGVIGLASVKDSSQESVQVDPQTLQVDQQALQGAQQSLPVHDQATLEKKWGFNVSIHLRGINVRILKID